MSSGPENGSNFRYLLGKAMREFQKGLREPPEIEKAPESDPSKSRRKA